MAAKKLLWKCHARTKAKLEIVRNYLGAWFGILAAKGFKHLVYIDGFCGPGQYEDGEEGSPVIATKMASATAQKYPGVKVTLIFVDKDKATLDHLRSLDPIKKAHSNVTLDIRQGAFADKLDGILSYLNSHPQSPTFSFVDPFGFGQTSFDRFKLLMHNSSSELFINFMCGFMNRFKEHHDEDVIKKIKGMVGTADLQPFIEAADPTEAMCQAFEDNLKTVGKYTLKFAMRDEGNIRDNAFFFCGRNARGFEKIKTAMWKVDPEYGAEFSAHAKQKAAAREATLFDVAPQTSKLSALLIGKFAGQKDVPVSEIFKWVLEETPTFLDSHARTELDHLFERGGITVTDPSATNRKRAKGQWPPRLLVTFE